MGINTDPLQHLRRVCAWANEPGNEILRAPFTMTAYDLTWAVAVTPYFGVAVRSGVHLRDVDPIGLGVLRTHFFPPLPEDMQAPGSSLATLKEWCGKTDWPAPEACPNCKNGEDKESCTFCDGFGLVVQVHEESPGWIGDVLIDRAFLGWMLEPFTDELVSICMRGPLGAVNVIGKGWIVTVMPRGDRHSSRAANAPQLMALPVRAPALRS